MPLNAYFPAYFISISIYSYWVFIVVSFLVGATLFYGLIKNISLTKATLISLIGIASSMIGIVVMAILTTLIFYFIIPHVGTYPSINTLANKWPLIVHWLLMYSGSVLIELLTLKLFFKYKTNQLLLPILIGNLITYLGAALDIWTF